MTDQIEVDWTRLTAPDIRALAERGNALAVLPIGSLEQHGPHLPVITDTRTAHEVALRGARIAAAAGEPVLVLPGLWTGMSEHHLPFGGTISLNYAELRGVLTGITRSLRAIGFGRLLVVNGHGGNIDPLSVACRELAVEFGMPIASTTPWFVAGKEIGAILETAPNAQHACEGETSVMLAMTAETVRMDRVDEAVRQAPAAVPSRAGYNRFWSFSERAPATGVVGDPRPATAAKGERLLDAMAAAIAEAMQDRTLWRMPDQVWAAKRGFGSTTP